MTHQDAAADTFHVRARGRKVSAALTWCVMVWTDGSETVHFEGDCKEGVAADHCHAPPPGMRAHRRGTRARSLPRPSHCTLAAASLVERRLAYPTRTRGSVELSSAIVRDAIVRDENIKSYRRP